MLGRPSMLGIGLVVVATLASEATASSPDRSRSAWGVGEPVAVAVRGGKARFRCPTPRPGSKIALVVSAIGRSGGPYPIRIETRAADRGDEPDREALPARRGPIESRPPAGPARQAMTIPPFERAFSILSKEGDVASASNYTEIRARLRAVGRRVQVYVDPDDEGRVGANLLRDVVSTCDDRVIPTATELWGPARDVDGDGRFTVLVSGKLGRLGGGRLSADGFVRGADLDPEFGPPFGNRCDMMYLNAAITPGPYLRTILAHEYTHAVSFSRKVLGPEGRRSGVEEEGWLDEATAHLAEDLHGFSRANLDHRVAAFLADPGRYRLVVEDYYASDLFRSHGHRGATYLFLRWCVDEHGPGLLSTLIRSPGRGIAGLEAASGSTFRDLYRGWTVALALSGLDRPGGGPSRAEGPRTTWIEPGDAIDWTSPGTTTLYAVVGGVPGRAVEVEVSAPIAAELQVTAIPIPDDLPRLRLSARTLPVAEGEAPQVVLRVRQDDGALVRLDGFTWAPLIPPPATPGPSSRGGRIGPAALSSAFGTAEVGPGVTRLSRPIGLPGLPDGPGPIALKILAADPLGRRVSAWAILGDEPEPPG